MTILPKGNNELLNTLGNCVLSITSTACEILPWINVF